MESTTLLIKTIDTFDNEYNLIDDTSTITPPPFEESGRFETYGTDKEFVSKNFYQGQLWSFMGEYQINGLKEDAVYFEVTKERCEFENRDDKYYLLKDDFNNYLLGDSFRTLYKEEIELWFEAQYHGETREEILFNITTNRDFIQEIESCEEIICRKMSSTEIMALKEEYALILISNIVFGSHTAISPCYS